MQRAGVGTDAGVTSLPKDAACLPLLLVVACCYTTYKPVVLVTRLRLRSHSYATSSVIFDKLFAMGSPPASMFIPIPFESSPIGTTGAVIVMQPTSATASRSLISALPVHSPASCPPGSYSRSLGCIGRMSSIPPTKRRA